MEQEQGLDEQASKTVNIEKAVLGGIMLDPADLSEVLMLLDPGDFYLPIHSRIFREIIAVRNSGVPVDFISVYDRLQNEPFDTVANLYDAALPGCVVQFAKMIKRDANFRKAKSILRDSIDQLGHPGSDLQSQYDYMASDFAKILSDRPASQTVSEAIDKKISDFDNGIPPDIMKTHFAQLDMVIGGFVEGDYVIVAGRPSMGKSAFAQNLCVGIAKAGRRAAWVAVEGNRDGFLNRLISVVSGVPLKRIKFQSFHDSDYAKIVQAKAEIKKMDIAVLDQTSNWPTIKAWIEMQKFKNPDLSIVFVDYLGLLRSPGFKDPWRELSSVSGEFKMLCSSLGIRGIMMSQINRKTEDRKDHHPTLGDLRDTGSLEQDADMILLLYRPKYYDQKAESGLIEIGIAKNRDGATDSIELNFDSECVRFFDR